MGWATKHRLDWQRQGRRRGDNRRAWNCRPRNNGCRPSHGGGSTALTLQPKQQLRKL